MNDLAPHRKSFRIPRTPENLASPDIKAAFSTSTFPCDDPDCSMGGFISVADYVAVNLRDQVAVHIEDYHRAGGKLAAAFQNRQVG